jgi:hypothetical protein
MFSRIPTMNVTAKIFILHCVEFLLINYIVFREFFGFFFIVGVMLQDSGREDKGCKSTL